MNQVERAIGGGQSILPNGDQTVPGEPALVRGGVIAGDAVRAHLQGVPLDRDEADSHCVPPEPGSVPEAVFAGPASKGDSFPDRAQALLGYDAWQGVPKGQRTLIGVQKSPADRADGAAVGSVSPMDQARIDAMASVVLSGVIS